MSQRDRRSDQGRRAARDKLRLDREKERQSTKRLRTLRVVGVAIFVVAVAGLVSIAVVDTGKGGSHTTETRPVTTGSAHAPVELTVYEDFRCPACEQFETRFRPTIRGLEKQGKLKTQYHLVTLIDGNAGGTGSRNAANAALCAEDEKKFAQYHDALYENQPPEEKDSFASNARLMSLAKKVPELTGSLPFQKCVTGGKNVGRVTRSNAAFKKSGYQSTPTVLLDGKNVYGQGSRPLTPQSLKRMVLKKAGS